MLRGLNITLGTCKAQIFGPKNVASWAGKKKNVGGKRPENERRLGFYVYSNHTFYQKHVLTTTVLSAHNFRLDWALVTLPLLTVVVFYKIGGM